MEEVEGLAKDKARAGRVSKQDICEVAVTGFLKWALDPNCLQGSHLLL